MSYRKEMDNQIIQGNALDVLKTLPSGSVNCVMTSPPYWALRDYKIKDDVIWDGVDGCEHQWGDIIPYTKKDERTPEQKKNQGATVGNSINSENFAKGNSGSFCLKCNAWKGQLGLEPTFDLYIEHLCDIFDDVRRVLRKDGTCWVNIGDTYYSISGGKFLNDNLGSKDVNLLKGVSQANALKSGDELEQKNLCNIPARFSIEMQNRGWILRNTIIWHKPNCMPSSVKDRFTVDFEYVFFFVKSKRYFFETQYEAYDKPMNRWGGDKLKADGNSTWDEGVGQNTYRNRNMRPNPFGRNKRTTWTITTKGFPESHFAVYPEELCETPLKAGCPEFVCKKCGKPREKIIKTISGKGEGKPYNPNRPDGFVMNGRNRESEHIFEGYSGCGCDAGFEGGIVLDPFFGAGTTGLVTLKQNKRFIGIELNPEYIKIAEERLKPYLQQKKLTEVQNVEWQ
jgi:DNA modification methylase